jgi:two-component system, NarL family, sensor histidine kinase DegS
MTEASPTTDRVATEVANLERELSEIEMLIAQARTEAERHENKRTQAAEKLSALSERQPEQKELVDLATQVATLTRRAAMMESQVEVLEGKRKTLTRFRDSLAANAGIFAESSNGAAEASAGEADELAIGPLPPALSRIVLTAQEDLRREIARAMHDGPAQSLTNIVLQAQIVERLLEQDPALAQNEVQLLIGMVQQTLEATKSFIFDVRPMVLDDLGLVPTLRRAARDRGQRAGMAVDFESIGADRRLPVELESGLFRILDEALAGYLSLSPDSLALKLDWTDVVEARVTARRAGDEPLAEPSAQPADAEHARKGSKDKELPPALAAMMEQQKLDERAAAERKRSKAIAKLPPDAWREIQQRASPLGISVELLDGGGSLRIRVPIPEVAGAEQTA